MPYGVSNTDTFDPLYVIARLAGQEWEQKLDAAALALASGSQPRSSAAELLLDIYCVFTVTRQKRMFTRDLLEIFRDERCAFASLALKYSEMDEYRIAQMLRPYGIKSTTLRVKAQLGKGYAVEDFGDALARYLPKADVEARIQQMEQEKKLLLEADAELQALRRRSE
ncbi:MAG TPA: DUF3631 domain-containing protein [Candidatus Sulfotelmatobacter sp.]|nr:DUF3631 domain-containing protein [Candidatus Sulfotelmatobacter sp.]